MVLKRNVFGTYVKDGLNQERVESRGRRKGFRTPKLQKKKLKNPFHIYNIMFNFNRDYTKVPTKMIDKKP